MARIKALTLPELVLLAYIALVFLLGGGARDDIATLAVLRPLSIIVLAYAVLALDPAKARANRALLILAGAWVALVALHLVPLPPTIWQNLPGRELAAAIDQAAGLGDQWRPLSLVPFRTVNALLSLSVPLAALMLALNLTRLQLRTSVLMVVAMALASALLSLLQVIGGPGNPFYLYRITNADSAVGLFANRNHNAILLALAILTLGAFAALHPPSREQRRVRSLMVGAVALGLVPFLIITQSRAGLMLGLVALAGCAWLHRAASAPASSAKRKLAPSPQAILAAGGAATLAALTWLLTAGNALSRLTGGIGADEELRLRIWPVSMELAIDHFPTGSGIGTFVEVYEVAEPASTLGPSYINHAHNDFLELALTGGLPAMVIVLLGLIWLIHRGFYEFRSSEGADLTLRWLGGATIGIVALGSAYDYPLRTPSLAIVFILALVWIAGREPLISPEKAPANSPDKQVRRSAGDAHSAAQAGV